MSVTALTVDAELTVPDGFVAEKIYEVPNKEQGSWISLAADHRGRIYAGSERHGIYRFTVPQPGGTVTDAQPILKDREGKLNGVQAVYFGSGSLYAMANDKEAAGLYRITDTDGDDVLDKAQHIVEMEGRGGHGLHGIIPSPDGKTLTINAGNMGKLPLDIDASRVPRVWGEDQLLPRLPDSNGHASGLMAPGGWAARINPDGSNFEIIATGFRNEYDITYNRHGDL
jgi:glucose/arabinose dehydrogenase